MSRNRKLGVVAAILAACIVGGAVGAQLYLTISMDGMQWSMSSSQIRFSETYWHGAGMQDCIDYDFVSGAITGVENQTFDATLPWYPDLEIYYKEMVAVERVQHGEAGVLGLDLTWGGLNISDTSGLVYLEVYGFLNELESTTTTLIGHWDTVTGMFVLDNDFDFVDFGHSGGNSDYIIVGIRAMWTSNPQVFTLEIGCIAA